MKKFISLMLSAVILAGTSACSANQSTNSEASQSSADTTAASTAGQATEAKKDYSEEQKQLENSLKQMNFSGVVRITENGETICEVALGKKDSSTGEEIKPDTQFCVGSVSKQFTAASIMLLQEEGRLSVDDKLEKYFPGYKYGKDLTVKNLLSMRSGIAEFYDADYIDNVYTELPAGELSKTVTNGATVEQNQKALESWLLEQPLTFEPDSTFTYSNSNYFLLARIVEIVSGKKYNAFVRESFFEPLGMKSSTFIDDVDWKNLPNLAKPTVDAKTVYVGITMGLGDIISNADDMDVWLTSLRTNRLLSAKSVDAMIADYSPEDDLVYGYGLIPDGMGGAFHYGYFTTYHAMAYIHPEKKLNLFAVTNDDAHAEGDFTQLCHYVIQHILDK